MPKPRKHMPAGLFSPKLLMHQKHKINVKQKGVLLMIDLHVHSVRSDGTLTPTELVDYAMKKGLSAFALTDHDTTDGLAEAMEYADCLRKKLSDQVSEGTADEKSANTVPEIIPGIELSTDDKGTEVHIVGLFIDPTNPTFREYLTDFVNSRNVRNQKMCLKLQELGLPVIYEELLEKYPDCILTRAHFARHLKDLGYVKSNQEAFDLFCRYIDNPYDDVFLKANAQREALVAAYGDKAAKKIDDVWMNYAAHFSIVEGGDFKGYDWDKVKEYQKFMQKHGAKNPEKVETTLKESWEMYQDMMKKEKQQKQ